MTAEAIGGRLAALYRKIETSAMRDAPICETALQVEAIGIRDFSGYAVGIVVTPWFLNLVVGGLSGGGAPEAPARAFRLRFPPGVVDFVVTEMAGFERLGSRALLSPMADFPDQETARARAQAALAALFDPRLHAPDPEAAPRKAFDRRAFLGRGRRQQDAEP